MMNVAELRPGIRPDRANELAHAVQANVPFTERPFATIGSSLGLGEDQVLGELRGWSESGKLREISAILEGSALGYDSALVAGKISESRLDEVARVVNAHPTVTHDYVRAHAYNLWFTLAVPREMGIERTLAVLARQAGVACFHALRRTQTFKVGVNFDLLSKRSVTEAVPLSAPAPVRVGERERRLFRALQSPLPLVPRPFAELARAHDVRERELIAFGADHLGGAIRRYVATFHHRKLGVAGNGMAVWQVAPEQLSHVGPLLAQFPEVSHCYARNAIAGFPYTLYSMLHGPDRAAVQDIAERISSRLGLRRYLILFSTRELKKCRLRYFLPELDRWWAAAVH
jgi:DNA-binding Lrp family transcriptional regulator